jgi:dTMP kinase
MTPLSYAPPHPRGLFLTFEGGEGSGKSTQARLLVEALKREGVSVLATREPGGTPLAEKLRASVVEAGEEPWLPESELLLFLAARFEHVQRVILPALQSGVTVVCDRFVDSTRAYQGMAKGLGTALIDPLHRLLFGNLTPDVTFLLDIDPEQGLTRAASRHGTETRFEALGLDFHTRLREAFLGFAAAEPERIRVIDAARDMADIHTEIMRLWHAAQ